jgi:hypothetical protein
LAPDISVAEVALLARAMTYKFAALDVQMGGAKAGVRGDPADRAGKAALMARFCAEIAPLADTGRLLTGPDMGTAEEDFAPLREHRASPAAISAVVDGVPFEDCRPGARPADNGFIAGGILVICAERRSAEAVVRERYGRGAGLPMKAMRISRAESVPGAGAHTPAQRTQQDHRQQGNRRDGERSGEIENQDR